MADQGRFARRPDDALQPELRAARKTLPSYARFAFNVTDGV